MSATERVRGLSVLVVEDEFPVLLMLEDMLQELGCVVSGAASRLAEAHRLLEQKTPDVALLDVNLAGETVYSLAEALAARKIPIVFSTGYGYSGVDAAWRDRVILQKPFETRRLAEALAEATAR